MVRFKLLHNIEDICLVAMGGCDGDGDSGGWINQIIVGETKNK